MSAAIALSIRGAAKSFGETAVLRDIDLDVQEGEFISLLGPSGCGKTTTLNIVAGFITPDKGDVVIGGRRVNDVPVHLRDLGMVFQGHALFPHMNCFDNVAFGLRMRKQGDAQIRSQVNETLALVHLDGFEQRFPRELSGGQQQRVGLARALVVKPRVLLLDEPLSNLDAKLRRAMQVELRAIHTKVRTTMIYVTHDQEEALTLSDRIAVMQGGRIEQIDTPEGIYLRPRTRFVADFIGSTSFVEGKVIAVSRGGIEVEIDGAHHVQVATDRAVELGSVVQLGVRADRIRLASAEPAAMQGRGLAGTVVDRVFAGSSYRVIADIGGERLLSANFAEAPPATVRSGATVQLEVAPTDWIVLQ